MVMIAKSQIEMWVRKHTEVLTEEDADRFIRRFSIELERRVSVEPHLTALLEEVERAGDAMNWLEQFEDRPEIPIGTICIGNEFDRASLHMMAVITNSETKNCRRVYTLRYLQTDGKSVMKFQSTNPTPVEDFGIKLHFNDDFNRVSYERVGESKATYSDGCPRRWQPEAAATLEGLRNWIKLDTDVIFLRTED